MEITEITMIVPQQVEFVTPDDVPVAPSPVPAVEVEDAHCIEATSSESQVITVVPPVEQVTDAVAAAEAPNANVDQRAVITEKTGMAIHPVCDLFPLMSTEEIQKLGNDIRTHGLLHPIVVHDGQIVDGRNRLLASFEAGVEPRYAEWHDIYKGEMPLARWIWSVNAERRHLTVDQITAARVALSAWEEREAARQRQADGQKRGGQIAGKGRPKQNSSPINRSGSSSKKDHSGDTRAILAKDARSSERKVQQALNTQKADPGLLKQVVDGTVTLCQAQKRVKAKDTPAAFEFIGESFFSVATWNKLPQTERLRIFSNASETGNAKFNRTNESVDWAQWTWNPVTGCKHGCSYCYARDIANRFYPQKFAPTFYPSRLAAPHKTKAPSATEPGARNVFVCSMADLFGEWVPNEWIETILKEVRSTDKWNYLFLTKNPERLIDVRWPANAWVGATVDTQGRVTRTEEAFKKIKSKVKWLSCEPLREKLTFTSLEMFDFVVIGAQTGPRGQQPEWGWVESLMWQARKAGCRVFWKSNLTVRPREFPDGPRRPRLSPAELPATVTAIESNQTKEE